MENVIDFYTRKSQKDILKRYFQKNDELAEKHGMYIGCLKDGDTKVIRDLSTNLQLKHVQIEQLTSEWEILRDQYYELLEHCLSYLGLPDDFTINLEQDSVMISVEGHSWVIRDYKRVE